MEHAQLEVSWLHPPEAQLVQDPAQYTTHLVVSIHYTIHYTWCSLFTLCVVLSCARNPLQAGGDCTVGLCGLACVVGWLGARGCL